MPMADDTYRGLLENISEKSGTYKQMLEAIAEGGGGGGTSILFANVDTTTESLDKTWQEIASADVAYVIMANARLTMKIPVVATIADASNNAYYVGAVGVTVATGEGNETEFELTQYTFKATSADGYPVFQF
jgi:hypothetical protein